MKFRRMCKVNKAACAGELRDGALQYAHISGILRLTSPKPLWILRHIILYTHARLPLRQTSSLEGRRHFQSPSRSGLTLPLSTIRLLRSSRPGSAQIRDVSIARAASEFGFSRPTIYQAQSQFQKEGLEGLLPRKRGPKQAHKLRPNVLAHLRELASAQPASSPKELARALRQRFRVKLHPRTVEKALHAEAKKGLRNST